APAQLAAVSMFLFVAVATDVGRSVTSRRRWLWAAGLAGATVLCTKETFGLVVLALAGLLATGWVIARREAATVLGLAVLGYGVCVVIMGFVNGFGVWWQ